MGCRTRTKRSTTSKHALEPKLNAANAVVVDSLTDHADAVVHDLGEPRSLVAPDDVAPILTHDGVPPLAAGAGGAP